MSTFHDELAALCQRHSKAAEESDDRRTGYSDMIIELSAALGRTIGLAADGNREVVGRITHTAVGNVAKEAAETSAKLDFHRWKKTEGTA